MQDRKYSDKELAAISAEVSGHPCPQPKPEPLPPVPLFHKVYTGPGYPIDPAKEKARQTMGYLNCFAPTQGRRTFDRTHLKRWLNESVN